MTWLSQFPALSALEAEPARLLREGVREIALPAGTVVFHEGDLCQNYMLVLEGQIRVQKVAETGREIVLYRVETGQSCILTTSCLIASEAYTAAGLAETAVKAVVIPSRLFHHLLGLSAVFRMFVFSAYAKRLAGLLALIDEVAFGRVDLRLARLLLERRDRSGSVRLTHQELAVELGSAREVVSRQLKEFERRGWATLHRGSISVDAVGALEEMSNRM